MMSMISIINQMMTMMMMMMTMMMMMMIMKMVILEYSYKACMLKEILLL